MRVALNAEEFVRVRDLLSARAGLVFDESRRDSLSYSLAERLRSTGSASLEAYLDVVSRGGDELQALLNEVTIQETHFFRNPPQFRALRQHVLPQLIKKAATGDRRIRVWSAGCSTGEEPYSVAMLLRELLPLTDAWDIKVIATDISTRALDAARSARYGERAVAVAPVDDVARWFTREGSDYVVRPEVRELVEFRHHNLVSDPPPIAPGEELDLILCRNVTIYFGKETTRLLVARFHESLADGGYLFIGHSETLWQVNDQFRLITLGDAFVYRRDVPAEQGRQERRTVLPDRRTGDDGQSDGERRTHRGDRRAGAWDLLTKSRSLPRLGRTHERMNERLAEQAAERVLGAAPVTAELPDPLDAVRAALRAGSYAEAAAGAESVAAAAPMRAEAHYLRGLALANLGRDRDAVVDLRKAVYVDAAAGFAHFVLAGVLARLGEGDAARRSYRAAAEALGNGLHDGEAAELGGRSVEELAELCRQLAGDRKDA